MSDLFIRDYLRDQLRSTDVAGRNESSGDIFSRVLVQRVLTPSGWQERIVAQAGPNGGLVDGDGNVFLQSGSINGGVGVEVDQENGSATIGIRASDVLTSPVIETITRWTTLELGQPYAVVAWGDLRVWVANRSSRYQRGIDVATMTVGASADLGSGNVGAGACVGGGRVWITDRANHLYEVNGDTGAIVNTYTLSTDADSGGIDSREVIYSQGLLYVVNHDMDHVQVLDPTNGNVVATIGVGDQPYGLAADASANRVFVSNYTSGTISVIDTVTRSVVVTWTPANIQSPRGIEVAGGKLWIANSTLPSTYLVIAVDLNSGETVKRVAVPEGDQTYDVHFDGVNIRSVSYAYYGGDTTNSCRLYTISLDGEILAARNVGYAHQRGMTTIGRSTYVGMAGNQSELVVAKPARLNAIYEVQAGRAGWPEGVIREQFDKLRYVREVDLSSPSYTPSASDADNGIGVIDGLILSANTTAWVDNRISTYGIQIQVPDTTGRACGFSTGRKGTSSGSFASNEDFLVVGKILARTHSNLAGLRHYFGSGIYTSGSSSALADPAVSTDPRLSIISSSDFVQLNVGSGWVDTTLNVNGKNWYWSIERFRGVMVTRLSLDGVVWVTVNTQTGITTGGGRILGCYNVCTDDVAFGGAGANNNLYALRFWIGRDPRN